MQSKRLSRREFLSLASAAGGTALLAACAPKATPEATEAPAATKPPEATEAPAATKPPEATEVVATEPPAAELKRVGCALGQWQPTEWTTRSAEHPTVVNATRILAERFMDMYPNVEIFWIDATGYTDSTEDHTAWLTARISGGDAPDLIYSLHNVPVQNGWALPIEEYLDQPNPFAPEYPRWRDIFYPKLMESLVWGDGHEYCATIGAIWPNLEIGLVYNKGFFAEHGLEPPRTWTEEKEVSRALKEMGSGLSPWPPEQASGNCWPLALQLLPPMMQEVCAEMDLNGDKFVNIEEALPAFKKGLIGPNTPIYRRAWAEMYELATYWVDDFMTTDLDLLFRQGGVALQYQGVWEFSALGHDPTIEFEIGFLPPPMPNSQDIPPSDDMPGAFDPMRYTEGDGSVPADLLTAVQGPDLVILKPSVEAHDNLAETLLWWQFMTTPENDAFIINENEVRIPSAKDAPLGPIFSQIAHFKLPLYEYSIAWWGQGLFWDAANFTNWRKVFVDWITGQIDEETFFERQQQEFEEGAARYEETLGD